MKKICIIHKVSSFDPRSFYKHGRSLVKAGYETVLIGFYDADKCIQGMRLVGFRPPHSRIARFIVTNYKIFLHALREKADYYHFHDLDFIPWAVALKLLTGSKVIYDIHEAYPEYILIKSYIPVPIRWIVSKAVYLMEHVAVKFFDAITPNDNFVGKDFQHKNNIVIFNFPALDFFQTKKIESELPWKDRAFDLIYHGSLPKYHVETMMRISEKLNSESVRNVWGLATNDSETVSWAREQLQRRGLQSNFNFLPYIDYLSVVKYLNNARIGIIPLPPYQKFMKNIPLKMFEFMGCGLPMVLSDLPPSRQFIQGRNCAIAVDPDNISEYVKAIKYLLDNPERAVAMGTNGRRLIYETYNWNMEEVKLLHLYQTL